MISDNNDEKKVFVGQKKTLDSIAKKILAPLIHNESVTVIWFPGTGKSFHIKEIFSESYLRAYFNTRYDSFFFVQVNMNSLIIEQKSLGFLQSIHIQFREAIRDEKSISISTKSAMELYHEICDMCRVLLSKGLSVSILIDEIETLTTNEKEQMIQMLSNIVDINRNRIHAIINCRNLNTISLLEQNELTFTLLQNIIYIPLISNEESIYFVSTLEERAKLNLRPSERVLMTNFYGNKFLMKAAHRILRTHNSKTLKDLLNQRELKIKGNIFLKQIGMREKVVLRKIIFKESLNSDDNGIALAYLKEIGVLNKKNKTYVIKPVILSNLIKIENQNLQFKLNHEDDLFYGMCNLSNVLSPNEYRVLKTLYLKQRQILSRDEIARAIWGKNYHELYSDWAIDKTISRLKTKLESIGVNKEIVSLFKGKGYQMNI